LRPVHHLEFVGGGTETLMRRAVLIVVGCVATALAIAGALLPGLPTTPFLLVALWAFARSSETLYRRLERTPLLRTALAEARRFEAVRAVRAPVKVTALSFAWGAVLVVGATTQGESPVLLWTIAIAAVAATLFMWWVPTARN
jgi:uncharacterized membrane protein YbaN (DUF454 family)